MIHEAGHFIAARAVGMTPRKFYLGFWPFTALFVVAVTRETTIIGKVAAGTPAAAAHVQVGDRVLAVAGQKVAPKDIPAHIRATEGRPFTLLVDRHGRRVMIPVQAK